MINSITIENFKGISKPVTIDFKPLTLLFGANSVCKSTVFHALYYLHKILTQTGSKGDKVIYYDHGDFISMVNDNDPSKDINITLDCRVHGNSECFMTIYQMVAELWADNQDAVDLIDSSEDHTDLNPRAILKISIGMLPEYDPNRPVIKLIELSFMRSKISIDYSKSEIDIHCIDRLLTFFAFVLDSRCGCSSCEDGIDVLVRKIEPSLKSFKSKLLDLEYGIHDIRSLNCESNDRIIIKYDGPNPVCTGLYELYEDTFLLYKHSPIQLHQKPFLMRFIDILMFGVFDSVVENLNEALYINPLREMPSRDLTYAITDVARLSSINAWLGPENFDTGLFFQNDKKFLVDLTDQEYEKINKLSKKELIDRIRLGSQQTVLKRITSKQNVSLSDVGFGISQLLPIIDAYTKKIINNVFVFTEQPELHLHPKMQTVLADLFISWSYAITDCPDHKTIIETHSEHLLLRLLRRIRETSTGALPDGCSPITRDQVAVHYFERKDGVVSVRKLEISADGDSIGEWPKGFFEERAGELF